MVWLFPLLVAVAALGFLTVGTALLLVRRETARLGGQLADSAERLSAASRLLTGESAALDARLATTEDELSRLR